MLLDDTREYEEGETSVRQLLSVLELEVFHQLFVITIEIFNIFK